MDAPLIKAAWKSVSSFEGLVDGLGGIDPTGDLPVFPNRQTAEGQYSIELVSGGSETRLGFAVYLAGSIARLMKMTT